MHYTVYLLNISGITFFHTSWETEDNSISSTVTLPSHSW